MLGQKMYDQFNQIAMLFVHPIMKIQPHLLLRERERDRDGNFKFKTDNLNKSLINNDIFNLKYKLWHLRQ